MSPSIAKPLFVDVEVGAAATTGIYSVVIDPASDATGTYAWSISAITEGSAPQAPDGVSRDATTTMPGERAYRTFGVTAGERIYVRVSSADKRMATWILAPDGTTVLVSDAANGNETSLELEVPDATTTGTYTLVIDPSGGCFQFYKDDSSIYDRRTRHLVSSADLALMKPDAILVNTARAELIESNALHDALVRGRPGFAAVDVYEQEPVTAVRHPLQDLPNCLCTPHLGFAERDNFEHYFSQAFDHINAFANEASKGQGL